MPTPAEIIAARVNGTYVEPAPEDVRSQTPAPDSAPAVSLSDESAFPVLGGGSTAAAANAAPLWGPAAGNGAMPSPPLTPSAKKAPSKFASSTLQEAFSLDAADQQNVARPEFIKILTAIKTATATNIECTTSQHTKKRTFLITGKPDQVKLAKRLVIKKLTKPVTLAFAIPARVRAKVIGAQGRNLKPIIQQTEVKIDIGHVDADSPPAADDDEDDVYAQTVSVTIEGDAEGCKQAKSQILAIVKEETKNLQIRVPLDAQAKPFAAQAIQPVLAKYPGLDVTVPPFGSSSKSLILSGDREEALAARDEIKQALADFLTKIVVFQVKIPKSQHQFLPIEQILEDHNVVIELPTEDSEPVKFIGEEKDIPAAREKAKSIVAGYSVEVLDMGKAHRGNLSHVRAVAALFSKYGVFDSISSEFGVKINPPAPGPAEASIPVEIVVTQDTSENAKVARRAIVAAVNKVTPDQAQEVADIDAFLYPRASKILDQVEGAKHVILNGKLIIFDYSTAVSSESDDFEDFDESASEVLANCRNALAELQPLQESLTSVVLPVSSKDQELLSSHNDSTLRSILAAVQPDSVTIDLHSNAAGESSDEIFIKGFNSEVQKVQKEIEEIIQEAKEYSATGGYLTTFEVPTFVLSRLIGKGGSTLNSIKDEFGVKIDIPGEAKKSQVSDKSLRTEISIQGIRRSAESAKEALAKLAKKLADDTLVTLRIEAEYHKKIIGPNFSSINRLQDRYNVKIKFPSSSNAGHADAPQSENEVTIRGPSKNVAQAEEELKQLYQFEKENGFSSSIRIPLNAIARVIGKNGNTINDISDDAGVSYSFRRDTEKEKEAGFAELQLSGTKKGLKTASERIQSIIDEIENTVSTVVKVDPKYHRELIGPNRSFLNKLVSQAAGEDAPHYQFVKLVRIPPEGSKSDEVVCEGNKDIVDKLVALIGQFVAGKEAQIEAEYDLAKEKHNKIIGTGGLVRRSLEEEFGVAIRVPKINSASTAVKLTGLPENVEKLKQKLDELTKDHWNEQIDVPSALHGFLAERGALIRTLKLDYDVEISHGNSGREATKKSQAAIPPAPENATAEEEATKLTTAPFEAAAEKGGVIPWRLSGSEENTARAAKLIEQQLQKVQQATVQGWFWSKTPSAHFSKIIGPQGSKLNEIRKKSGAVIMVPRANEKHADVIYLLGSDEAVQKAVQEFKKRI